MSDNVIPLGMVTRINADPERFLNDAKKHCPDGAVIIGYDKDGNEYFASSIADGGTVLWLLERLKLQLLNVSDQ